MANKNKVTKTFELIIQGSSAEELDENILRLACEIKDRREAARRQRVLDFMRGKNARS